jgi:hypothetical protein
MTKTSDIYSDWNKTITSFTYRDQLIYSGEVIPVNFKDFEPLHYFSHLKGNENRRWVDYKNKKIFYIKNYT